MDNQYKSDLLITDESKRLNKLEALHAKLAIDLKGATGKEHQMILSEEQKVQGKIQAIQKKFNDAKIAQAKAAAAVIKQQFDRVLSLDVSHILRSFDRAFASQMSAFDKATAAGLTGLAAPAQTPEEKVLADFLAGRSALVDAAATAQRETDLAAAISGGDPAQIASAQDAINQAALDTQQAGLQAAADASRVAADKKATDAQQAYQDQRDLQRQGLQDINDDQKLALQNNLDDWTSWLDAKTKSYAQFVAAMRAMGIDTSGLINPSTGAQGGTGLNTGSGTYSSSGTWMKAMASGGMGAVTRPTLFLAGEAGPEQYAFSGAGKSFGGGGGDTYNFDFSGFAGSQQQLEQAIIAALARANRRGSVSIPGIS